MLIVALVALGVVLGVIATLVLQRRRRRSPSAETARGLCREQGSRRRERSDRRRRGGPAAPDASAFVGASGGPTAVVDAFESTTGIVGELERPAPTAGRLVRLRDRLARSGSPLGARLLAVLSRDHLTADDWDELEETLLLADVGAGPSGELIEALQTRVRVEGVSDPTAVRAMLREELIKLVGAETDRVLNLDRKPGQPAVVLVVGVNGTGKTTTVGKLARVLVADDSTVLLGAADTFRAAAADQLQTWGARVGVETVRADKDGADPAAVAFDAVKQGQATGVDVVLVDTAGRLQNKAGLMDELGKIARVIDRAAPGQPGEVLLVLDATTGQNGMTQARVFNEVAGVTGIVLTKLDGTAKGGIVIAVQRELGVPVKLVGLGEGPDDLAPFDAAEFVDGILG